MRSSITGRHVLPTEVLANVMAIFRVSIRVSERLEDLTARLDRRVANLTLAYNLEAKAPEGGIQVREVLAALTAPLAPDRMQISAAVDARVARGVLPMLCIAVGELVDLATMDAGGPFQSKITLTVMPKEDFVLLEWVEDIGFAVDGLADGEEIDNVQFFRRMKFMSVPEPEIEWSGTRMIARFGFPRPNSAGE